MGEWGTVGIKGPHVMGLWKQWLQFLPRVTHGELGRYPFPLGASWLLVEHMRNVPGALRTDRREG